MADGVTLDPELTAARVAADDGRLEEAAALCRTMLMRDAFDPAALQLLGLVLLRQGSAAEAVCLLGAVAEQYRNAAALQLLGEALDAVGLREEAESRWQAASALSDVLPETWVSLGNLRLDRDDPAAAEQNYRAAVAARPGFAEAWNNLGNALTAQHRLPEAWQAYAEALRLRPGDAYAGFGYALSLLLGGDFARGWRHFEARREVGPLRWNYWRRPALPQWQPGMVLAGRRVLLMAEQGAGDIIHYVRYAPLLARHGAEVVLELPREMHAVFAGLPGIAAIIALDDPDPDCDLACPLLSLALYFATVAETIPAAVPYADVPPDRAERWRAWLGPAGGRRRIGLVCSGRPEHPNDRNRSIPLTRLAPILAAPGCDFVLLQPQLRDRDQAALAAAPALRWPGTALQDLADTAALLGELDLLVSVDTAAAHLAGALARPVWTLLPHAPDYRWLLGRGDSPWYPTMRLYRQPVRGDWDAAIAAVRRDLDDRR